MGIVTRIAVGLLLAQVRVGVPLAAQPLPSISIHRELRIDGNTADFSRIVYVSVGEDGSIVVAQPDDGHLRFLSGDGRTLGRFGRAGQGPGEFQSIGIYRGWVASEFWQYDFLQQRLVVLRSNRELARTVPMPGIVPAAHLIASAIVALLADGDLIIQGAMLKGMAPPAWAQSVGNFGSTVIVRVTSAGRVKNLVRVLPALMAGCSAIVSGRERPLPECPQWYGGFSPVGASHAAVMPFTEGPRAGQFRVTSVAMSGDTLFDRYYPVRLQRISRTREDSLRKQLIAGTKDALLQQDYRDMRLPDFFRPVHGILVGRDGRVWVALRPDANGRPWLVLDPNGNPVASVSVPANVRIEAVDATHVWGVETDADGTGSVVRCRLG